VRAWRKSLVATGVTLGLVSGTLLFAGTASASTTGASTSVSYHGGTPVPGESAPSGDVVIVASPGTQTSTVGTAIGTLQMNAWSSKDESITSYTAGGLPPGLFMTYSGAIIGTPAFAGTYTVIVTATDAAGTTGSVVFSWVVDPAAQTGVATYSGTIRLSKLGLCLDDRSDSNTPGAVVQVWGCNRRASQQWLVMSNGTIEHNGLCLDTGGGTASGTKVELWTCTGSSSQQWDVTDGRIYFGSSPASGVVVDDTGFGRAGTQQEIWVNNGGANQIWATWY
jgi:hypothetical protein